MKYLHKIAVGNLSKSSSKYTYDYGHTKNIRLFISKKGICIEVDLSKMMAVEEILSSNNYLFADAIKKALLIYLIKYSKNLEIKSIKIQIDSVNYDIVNIPKIYSLIQGNLIRKMSPQWDNKSIIENILWYKKSYYGHRIASLFSLLIAKSKKHESEKFFYLWMSINGMYGYLNDIIKRNHAQSSKRDLAECEQIKNLMWLMEVGLETIIKKDSRKIAQECISIIKKDDAKLSKDFFNSEESKKLSAKIKNILRKNDGTQYSITPYGYLLFQLSYYFRCNFFHADKPTILFGFDDDIEIACLRKINYLLEEFLDEYLYRWFDKEYLEKNVKLKILKN